MPAPRLVTFVLAISFVAVGALFVAAPGVIFGVFDRLGAAAGLKGMPAGDANPGLFRVLAGAYMYLVALLAWKAFRNPTEPVWPEVMAHAKLASAALSLALLAFHGAFVVYLVNGLVDLSIGFAALWLRAAARNCGRDRASDSN
ncbi:MAG: hypothetical protein ACE148_08545 [Vicinamibacterales bacterium]